MEEHQCIVCSTIVSPDWWPIRNEDRNAYEAICLECADYCYECDCCGDATHSENLTAEQQLPGSREKWRCNECMDRCGAKCRVIEEREQLAEMREALNLERESREQQLSEVRDSLRVTLERMNDRPNLRGGDAWPA